MLNLERHHDFQVFVSPKDQQPSHINPPSFNWPQQEYDLTYTIELEHLDKPLKWRWENISSPFQLPFLLTQGSYRWSVVDRNGEKSEWREFSIDERSQNYLSPTAKALFDLCRDQDQFLMYFDEDIKEARIGSWMAFDKLKATVEQVDISEVTYPSHYRRGLEEGKRTAIANVRRWIDRDLIALTLLYKIWNDRESGEKAVELLLRLAEWSPEGPASLLRPCRWGDEVGLSLARNMYLAYHWLSPLLNEDEKGFVRPMLVRIAYQMEERLEQDQFKQFPGHSHTSRLPSYLGIAALALHKEFDQEVCERWLDYSLMIYRGVLPFYGGEDGSWVEGAFYSSSYSKWQHPFFLTVERLSDFSFYDHAFYRNYTNFAMDFVATEEDIHPFGDGFWCKRKSVEWPGFFAQNPLRVYADRFGDTHARELCKSLEQQIETYDLHLLDIVPTQAQIQSSTRAMQLQKQSMQEQGIGKSTYYSFAGLGKAKAGNMSMYYRASQFGNSSHRHGDQGNFSLVVNETSVLTPSGSYGYRFGSEHHSQWTRTTKAHNLPLIDGEGQVLDCESSTAQVITRQSGKGWQLAQIDLSNAYELAERFIRTLIFVERKGLIVCDLINLSEEKPLQWRLHTPLGVKDQGNNVQLVNHKLDFKLALPSHKCVQPSLVCGYDEDTSHGEPVISDANEDITHVEWSLSSSKRHTVVASCSKAMIPVMLGESDNLRIEFEEEVLDMNLVTGSVQQHKMARC